MKCFQVTPFVVVWKSLEHELHENTEIILFTGIVLALDQSSHVVVSQEILVECWQNELREVGFEP